MQGGKGCVKTQGKIFICNPRKQILEIHFINDLFSGSWPQSVWHFLILVLEQQCTAVPFLIYRYVRKKIKPKSPLSCFKKILTLDTIQIFHDLIQKSNQLVLTSCLNFGCTFLPSLSFPLDRVKDPTVAKGFPKPGQESVKAFSAIETSISTTGSAVKQGYRRYLLTQFKGKASVLRITVIFSDSFKAPRK